MMCLRALHVKTRKTDEQNAAKIVRMARENRSAVTQCAQVFGAPSRLAQQLPGAVRKRLLRGIGETIRPQSLNGLPARRNGVLEAAPKRA